MRKPSFLFQIFAIFIFGGLSSSIVTARSKYTKEEVDLSRPKRASFRDWRLRAINKIMARQYKHIYSHISADGYILPNEHRELLFHRNFMHRLWLIDKRNHICKKVIRRLSYKKRRQRRKLRRRYRRRRRYRKSKRAAISLLSSEEQDLYTKAKQKHDQYEKMIRRFSCRYLPKYPKRHKQHCRKTG